eukprot:760091-Hanusia_phi.AAC.3
MSAPAATNSPPLLQCGTENCRTFLSWSMAAIAAQAETARRGASKEEEEEQGGGGAGRRQRPSEGSETQGGGCGRVGLQGEVLNLPLQVLD